MSKINIQKIVLQTIIKGMRVFTPTSRGKEALLKALIDALEKELLGYYEDISRQQKYYIGTVVQKLIKNKSIIIAGDNLKLSDKGREQLAKYELGDYFEEKPSSWDGKYRIIIFDIPETKKLIRKALRKQLIEWGFIHLQHSVWVYPYECQEIITLLKTRFGIMSDALYMVVESIENDRWLKREFNLM
jgi:DNA-binding transcriptional regulator PaaX